MRYVLLILLCVSAQATETRKEIAIIDSYPSKLIHNSYLCENPIQATQDESKYLKNIHAFEVALIASENLDSNKYCVRFYPIILSPLYDSLDNLEITAHQIYSQLRNNPPAFINMSFVGYTFIMEERISLLRLLNMGTIITVAAGNDHLYLEEGCGVFPACYIQHKNYHVVGSADDFSNRGNIITDLQPSHSLNNLNSRGTSFSAPRVLNKIARGIYDRIKK